MSDQISSTTAKPPSPSSSTQHVQDRKDSPSPTTPRTPDANEMTSLSDSVLQPSALLTDPKLSRKREREVSLEPGTPKTVPIDLDPLRQDNRERRAPAKKGRTGLGVTEEEEESAETKGSRSPSRSPPLACSPRHELKVRQISRGVEDLKWQNGISFGKLVGKDEEQSTNDEPPSTLTTSWPIPVEAEEIDIGAEAETQAVDEMTPEPPLSTEPSVDAVMEATEGDEGQGGLKRKMGDRAVSLGPQDAAVASRTGDSEPVKRLRDDSDSEENKDTKKPSLPAPKEPPQSKPVGFMSYASTNSPFGALKGTNLFSGSAKQAPGSPSRKSEALNTKRTGFDVFGGSTSPFAGLASPVNAGGTSSLNFGSSSPGSSSSTLGSRLAGNKLTRAKSPVRRATPGAASAAFATYASGGAQAFLNPTPKRVRGDSPGGSGVSGEASGSPRSSVEPGAEGPNGTNDEAESGAEEERTVSFGEKLRAGRDEEEEAKSEDEKVALTELEVTTGEEEEETLHQVRGKLYSLSPANQWKERGTGTLKLNVRREDGGGARLVMRKEAVYALLLNVTLFPGMRCFIAQDPRYLRFSVIQGGNTIHYNLRVASGKVAQELLDEINANIPHA